MLSGVKGGRGDGWGTAGWDAGTKPYRGVKKVGRDVLWSTVE